MKRNLQVTYSYHPTKIYCGKPKQSYSHWKIQEGGSSVETGVSQTLVAHPWQFLRLDLASAFNSDGNPGCSVSPKLISHGPWMHTQPHLTLCNPMDCSALRSSVQGAYSFPGKSTRVGCHFLQVGSGFIHPSISQGLGIILEQHRYASYLSNE